LLQKITYLLQVEICPLVLLLSIIKAFPLSFPLTIAAVSKKRQREESKASLSVKVTQVSTFKVTLTPMQRTAFTVKVSRV